MLAGPEPIGTAYEAFKFVVFQDPNWDWHRFNPATDTELALKKDNGVLHSGNPDLKAFFNRGGKLLMYHGWSDPQVAPLNSVNYFTNVTRTVGKNVVGKSLQLYMVPGMAHCAGGPGTDTFDKMAAIEQWVATGKAPETISAVPLDRGSRRSHAAALSLRQGGEVEGQRQHRRCRELQLRGWMNVTNADGTTTHEARRARTLRFSLRSH